MPFREKRDVISSEQHLTFSEQRAGVETAPVHVAIITSEVYPYTDGPHGNRIPNMQSHWQRAKKELLYRRGSVGYPIHLKYFDVAAELKARGLRVVGAHSGNPFIDGTDNVHELPFPDEDTRRRSRWGDDADEDDAPEDGAYTEELSNTGLEYIRLMRKDARRRDWEDMHSDDERHAADVTDDGDDPDDTPEETSDDFAKDDFVDEIDEEPRPLTQAEKHRLAVLENRHCVRAACIISRMDAQDKYSEGYKDCIGFAVYGVDRKTREPVSMLAHINVNHFTDSDEMSQRMTYVVKKALREAAYVATPESLQVLCWGGKIKHEEPLSDEWLPRDEVYRKALLKFGALVTQQFRGALDPVIVSQPIMFGQDQVHAFVTTHNRSLLLSRPRPDKTLRPWEKQPLRMSELRALDAYAQQHNVALPIHAFGRRGDPDAIHPPRGVPDEAGHKDFW